LPSLSPQARGGSVRGDHCLATFAIGQGEAIIRCLILILTALTLALVSAGPAGSKPPQNPHHPQKPHDKEPVQKCHSARKAIVHYRTETWNTQKTLGIAFSATRYPERWAKNCEHLRWSANRWKERDKETQLLLKDPEKAICRVFKKYCTQALAVARCESGHSMTPRAHNGQYLGTFQMGSSERKLYGHGDTVLEQAKAAYRYFVLSGKDWSPWGCDPW
jgi:hypothetical protein